MTAKVSMLAINMLKHILQEKVNLIWKTKKESVAYYTDFIAAKLWEKLNSNHSKRAFLTWTTRYS